VTFSSPDFVEALHPLQPLRRPLLACGDGFETSLVQDALEARRRLTYGLVVVDGDEATLGAAEAPAPGSSACTSVSKLAHLSANIGSRTRRGGQSAARYARHRDGAELAFVRRVAEHAEALLGTSSGLVVAGRADLKRRLLEELSPGLRGRVVAIVDLACSAGAEGLRQAALRVPEAAERSRRQMAERAVTHFLDLLERPEPAAGVAACYGEAHTAAALRLGAVEQLLLAKAAQPSTCFGMEVLKELAAASGASILEIEARTAAEHRFCQGFGVGGCLRWPVDPALLEEGEPEVGAEANAGVGLEGEPPPHAHCLAAAAGLEKPSSEAETASTAPSQPDAGLLQWLEGALAQALGDGAAAAALAVCAEVVLGDETAAPGERLESTLEMLRAEGVPADVLAEFACHAADLLPEAM